VYCNRRMNISYKLKALSHKLTAPILGVILLLATFDLSAQKNKPYHEDLSKLRPKFEQPTDTKVEKDTTKKNILADFNSFPKSGKKISKSNIYVPPFMASCNERISLCVIHLEKRNCSNLPECTFFLSVSTASPGSKFLYSGDEINLTYLLLSIS